MLLQLKQKNDQHDHNKAHQYCSGGQSLIIEALELIVHKVLQHIYTLIRIIRREQVYLTEYLK